jgi:lipopolysaccharide transport system ATP-binding protein
MSDVAIRVENISKKYRILHKQRHENDSLIAAFAGGVKNMFREQPGVTSEEFWALKDISFDIKKGDRVGIIGRNGAGKSTLLKILSRIVKPTSGRIEFEGRMASLLEVGTGFHGDLTGRENIYLNGSILGMSKREIDRQFDAIVDFSEVEQFLDTPVKRYSSGMYVRLAFAVAAHLDPDILIVDEVLAVGDAAFQKKCLGKMRDVSHNGRTLFFVSHNMAAIQNLCDKSIYLRNGQLVCFDATEKVLPEYLKASVEVAQVSLLDRKDRMGDGRRLRFSGFTLKDGEGDLIMAAHSGSRVKFDIALEVLKDLSNVIISMGIDDNLGQRIAHCSNDTTNQAIDFLSKGHHSVIITFEKFPLKGGIYTFSLYSSVNGEIADWIQDAGSFVVETGDYYRTGKLPPEGQGSIFIDQDFSVL